MSYYHERKVANAKAYIAESEAQDRAEQRARDHRPEVETAREWLARYRTQPRPTQFNWSPRLTETSYLQGLKNVEEAKEDQVEQGDEEAWQDHLQQGLGDTSS